MTRRLVTYSALLALGLVLNLLTQAFTVYGMKPDFVLVTLCLALVMAPSLKEAFGIGLAFGILTALTSTFPYGEIANLVDKVLVSVSVYYVLQKIKIRARDTVRFFVLVASTTLLSGFIFLSVGLLLANSYNGLGVLFVTLVIPSALINGLFSMLLGRVFSELQH